MIHSAQNNFNNNLIEVVKRKRRWKSASPFKSCANTNNSNSILDNFFDDVPTIAESIEDDSNDNSDENILDENIGEDD